MCLGGLTSCVRPSEDTEGFRKYVVWTRTGKKDFVRVRDPLPDIFYALQYVHALDWHADKSTQSGSHKFNGYQGSSAA